MPRGEAEKEAGNKSVHHSVMPEHLEKALERNKEALADGGILGWETKEKTLPEILNSP